MPGAESSVANPELVQYIRQHLKAHGESAIREQLLDEGIAPEEVDAAFACLPKPKQPLRAKGKPAILALCAGAALIGVAVYVALQKPHSPDETSPAQGNSPPPAAGASSADETGIFRGHYGYMFKLPAAYEAVGGFDDPMMSHEVVHVYPRGTNPTHFIHDGLYGQLGILRIEASPRRRPDGIIGIEALKTVALSRLRADRSTYTTRAILVNGLPTFIISVTQPFAQVKAYLVGQKVYYIITAGADNELFNGILETLVETAPTDKPGP
jgi:hypothetical protein